MRDITQRKRTHDDVIGSIVAERKAHATAIDEFHRVFYGSPNTHCYSYYEGIATLKNPLDLWVLQEIIWDLRPTLLIETGTAFGGSALYYARQFDRVGEGTVLTIDVDVPPLPPRHPRVQFLRGSSVAHDIAGTARAIAKAAERVMVVLDSDHSRDHVLAELDLYAPMVTPGQFLVVEDTNINGRPVAVDWKGGPGPGPAVDDWLPRHPEFERSVIAERYMVTNNPGGWLRRTS